MVRGLIMYPTTRFVYSWHATRERAENALENYFAAGEVSPGERPAIVKRGAHWGVELNG